MARYANRIAAIAGGAGGRGVATAIQFGEEGARAKWRK